MKYLIRLAYDGAAYSGFQVQKNAPSVQSALCLAADSIFPGGGSKVTGCSRTDSGVHAREYFATLASPTGLAIPPQSLPLAMNSKLAPDISILAALAVDDGFSIRRSVVKKRYEYVIHNSAIRNPFLNNKAYMYRGDIDTTLMNSGAAKFLGTHDFRAFMASGSNITDTVRTVYDCKAYREGDIVKIIMEADGFLYNMVRITAGTLLSVGEGKTPPEKVGDIIESKNRIFAGKTLPPDGLYLDRVFLKDNLDERLR